MLLSVCMPHSGHDEEDYINALGEPRTSLFAATLTLSLHWATRTRIYTALTVSTGTGCLHQNAKKWRGRNHLLEKLRWLQRMKDFDCTVTSTWTNNEGNREFHAWRAWRSLVWKTQLDFIMG